MNDNNVKTADVGETENSQFKPRVFSGMQPTGALHIGNYLGAIRNFVKLQDHYPCLYCIVDLHAITVPQDPSELRQSIRTVTAAYLASGINPKEHIVFNQSQVTGHAELGWVFNCISRLGWLDRMTQFKDKAGKNTERASAGLYVYPNLMAADILLYLATHVPVGEDQKQHLELTRDIATKFNNDFGTTYFPITEPIIGGPAARVMSLRDGTKKMSKSDISDLSRINLNDDIDTIARKIKKAKTDPELLPASIDELEGRAEARNLVGIYAALIEKEPQDVLNEFAGKDFATFKPALTDLMIEKLGPITAEMIKLEDDIPYIDGVLKDGAERARIIADQTIRDVKDIIGFIQ